MQPDLPDRLEAHAAQQGTWFDDPEPDNESFCPECFAPKGTPRWSTDYGKCEHPCHDETPVDRLRQAMANVKLHAPTRWLVIGLTEAQWSSLPSHGISYSLPIPLYYGNPVYNTRPVPADEAVLETERADAAEDQLRGIRNLIREVIAADHDGRLATVIPSNLYGDLYDIATEGEVIPEHVLRRREATRDRP